jgi:hypothetical protein
VLRFGGQAFFAKDGQRLIPTVRLMLSAQKLLKLVGFIPFMWYYRKEDLHRLFEQSSFVIVDSDVLHPAPVNYYLLASKGVTSNK